MFGSGAYEGWEVETEPDQHQITTRSSDIPLKVEAPTPTCLNNAPPTPSVYKIANSPHELLFSSASL